MASHNVTNSHVLEEIVWEDLAIAHPVLLVSDHQFLVNREQRAIYLDAAFKTFV
jgi:hypothetical protein